MWGQLGVYRNYKTTCWSSYLALLAGWSRSDFGHPDHGLLTKQSLPEYLHRSTFSYGLKNIIWVGNYELELEIEIENLDWGIGLLITVILGPIHKYMLSLMRRRGEFNKGRRYW